MKTPMQLKNLKNISFEHGIIGSIFLLSFYKLNLLGSGFLAFPDEFRYTYSGMALKDFSELDLITGIGKIFSTDGRPGDAIIKIIPYAIQFLTGKMLGIDFYDSRNSFPLFIFNFLTYAGILFLTYRIANHILKNNYFALLSVLIYSSLTNSHIYLRHALPYDTSLVIFLYAIYKIIINIERYKPSFISIFTLGLFCFFGYLVYPGYILLYMTSILILIFYKINIKTLRRKFIHLIYFSLGSLSCLILFEILSRIAKNSYIKTTLSLSSTITQGSFDESFVFIFKYLIEVEKINGILLMIGLALTLFLIIKILIKKEYSNNSIIVILFFTLTFLYSLYAGYGYFFSKVVLYGRLLHQFFPFICIFMVFSICNSLKNNFTKNYISLVVCIFCVYNFFINIKDYLSHFYPKEIAWIHINNNHLANLTTYCEYFNSWSVLPHIFNNKNNINKDTSNLNSINNNLLIINCCFFYPVNDLLNYYRYKPTSKQKLVDIKKHFLNFKAYQYEGYNKYERQNLDKLNLKIKVFSY